MEFLGLVLIWPLLILVVGLVLISSSSVAGGAIAVPVIIVFLIFAFGLKDKLGTEDSASTDPNEQLDQTRRAVVAFSIALFLPIFVKYLLSVSGSDLPAMILGLIFGFGTLIWGMFIKNNGVLMYANIVGGAFVVIYLYSQLWSLGQLAQVVATAFGLVVAVAVSIIKFREKLT